MSVDYAYSYEINGRRTPNWREHLRCPDCGLNNRRRATLHFLDEVVAPAAEASVYLMEQTSPIFTWISRRYPGSVGSEYLGEGVPLGSVSADGVRNESASNLTFADGRFELVVSLDVLEHVPDYRSALTEIRRVLRPGGKLLLSVPFDPGCEGNLVRAEVAPDGSICHLLPPEYHGDPLRAEGCLSYRHFGWELLAEMREVELVDAAVYTFWSVDFGYLGDPLLLIVAER